MSDFKSLGQQISEQMKAYNGTLFNNPMVEFAKAMQALQYESLPISVKLANSIKQNIESIKAIKFDNSISRTIIPNINEIIKYQNQIGQSSISNIITKGLAAELVKNPDFLTNQFKFSIPEIKIPVDISAFNQSSGLLALQAIRHNQYEQLQHRDDLISRINDIGDKVRQGEAIDDKAIEVVIETLTRIEDTLNALQTNLKAKDLKLMSIDDIRFYFNLILCLLFFVIPFIGQLKTDEKIESIENHTNQITDKLDTVNNKIDRITDYLTTQEKWICSRDTYMRKRPNFKSTAIVKIQQFETVMMDNKDSVNHKWIKVRFIDMEKNDVKIGWVSKKYFKRN